MLALLDTPAPVEDLAARLDLQPESVRRRLGQLRDHHLAVREPRRGGRWELAPGAGMVLAAASGSSKVNAALFDPYLRMHERASGRRNALGAQRDPEMPAREIIGILADQIANVVHAAPPERLSGVKALAIAVPFGLDNSPDPVLLWEDEHETAGTIMENALADRGVALPFDRLSWIWTSDAAAEGVFEFWHGGKPQSGASPLVVVKLTRRLRMATIIGGEPAHGARGDLVDLGELRAPPDDLELVSGFDTWPKIGTALEFANLFAASGGDPEEYERVMNAMPERTDAELFEELFTPLLDERGVASRKARRAFADAGALVGRALDAAFTAIDPQVVVLVGFLVRDKKHLKDALVDAARHHRELGMQIEFSSGIKVEEVARTVVDRDEPPPDGLPQPHTELPHHYRVTAGAARLAIERVIKPALVEAARSAKAQNGGPRPHHAE